MCAHTTSAPVEQSKHGLQQIEHSSSARHRLPDPLRLRVVVTRVDQAPHAGTQKPALAASGTERPNPGDGRDDSFIALALARDGEPKWLPEHRFETYQPPWMAVVVLVGASSDDQS